MRPKTFTSEDVARWIARYGEVLPSLATQILRGEHQAGHLLQGFSRNHQLAGLALTANADYDGALAHYSAAGTALAYLLEVALHDRSIDVSLIPRAYYGFMFVVASGCSDALARMFDAYGMFLSSDRGVYASTPLGDAIYALFCDQRSSAAKSMPLLASRDPLAADLLEAILSEDDSKLSSALAAIHPAWKQRVRYERLHKFPDSVCDDRVLCWVRFAEHVWGRSPQVDISQSKVPLALFTARATSIDTALPRYVGQEPPN